MCVWVCGKRWPVVTFVGQDVGQGDLDIPLFVRLFFFFYRPSKLLNLAKILAKRVALRI
jgi:hypothetical protein